ncbi:hypothetical protein LEMLEM_LOCUS22893 [Lemmus lemmus]
MVKQLMAVHSLTSSLWSQRSLKARPVKDAIAVTHTAESKLYGERRSPTPVARPPAQVTNACRVSTSTGHQRLSRVHHHRSPTPVACPPAQVTEFPPLSSSPVPKFNSPSPRGPVTTTDVFTSYFLDSSAVIIRSNITRRTRDVKCINRQC